MHVQCLLVFSHYIMSSFYNLFSVPIILYLFKKKKKIFLVCNIGGKIECKISLEILINFFCKRKNELN